MEDVRSTLVQDNSAVREASLETFGVFLFQLSLVFGSHIGYVMQLISIATSNNIEGYSPLVSIILLSSNTLRVMFFIGLRFARALLFQSIVAIFVHGVLLVKVLSIHAMNEMVSSGSTEANILGQDGELGMQPALVVRVGIQKKQQQQQQEGSGSTMDDGAFRSPTVAAAMEDNFPQSGDLVVETRESSRDTFCLFQLVDAAENHFMSHRPASFIIRYFLWAISSLVVVMAYYFVVGSFWESAPKVVGYVALGIEACLALPQIIHNARRRSTEGLSIFLILTWVVGDIVKIVYFVLDKQPLPFAVSGAFQLSMDFVVVGQVVYYRFCVPARRRHRVEEAFFNSSTLRPEDVEDGEIVARSGTSMPISAM